MINYSLHLDEQSHYNKCLKHKMSQMSHSNYQDFNKLYNPLLSPIPFTITISRMVCATAWMNFETIMATYSMTQHT